MPDQAISTLGLTLNSTRKEQQFMSLNYPRKRHANHLWKYTLLLLLALAMILVLILAFTGNVLLPPFSWCWLDIHLDCLEDALERMTFLSIYRVIKALTFRGDDTSFGLCRCITSSLEDLTNCWFMLLVVFQLPVAMFHDFAVLGA